MSGKNTATTGFLSGSVDWVLTSQSHFYTAVRKNLHKLSRVQTEDVTVSVHFVSSWPGFFLKHLNSLPLPQIIHFSQKVWEMSTHGTELTISGRYGPIIKQLIRFHQSLSSSGHLASFIDKIISSERGSGN